jgi:sugar lactone lactonase YvrE
MLLTAIGGTGCGSNESTPTPSVGGSASADGGGAAAGDPGGGGGGNSGGANDWVQGAEVSTLAGAGEAGGADGPGADARFSNPTGVARAADGTLYVTEYDANRVRKIAPDATVSTIPVPDNFRAPYAVAVAGNTVIVQTDNTPGGTRGETSGTLWRLAPDGLHPVAEGLGRPRGLGALPDGRVVVADRLQHVLRILDPGTGALTPLAGVSGSKGAQDGRGEAARFNAPHGAAAFEGAVLVADTGNNRIRRIELDGTVSAFAGDGTEGTVDGERSKARFSSPRDVAVDAAGNVLVAETGGKYVRVIGKDGRVRTLAGDGTPGYRDGDGRASRFFGLESLDVAPDGKTVFVADGTGGEEGAEYNRLRKIVVP